MAYVNFPHQVNDIKKLEKMLETAQELITSRKPLDDSTYGYAMFDKGLIQSRKGYTKSDYKKLELNRQSPVMIAREIKRTFRLFGFLEESGGKFAITERGKRLAKFAKDDKINDEEKLIWREALLNLKFHSSADSQTTNENFRIRPIYVMMRLLESRSLERKFLVFALTALNESESTIRKLSNTIENIQKRTTTFDSEISKIGMTKPNAKNNVKILPTLAIVTELFESDLEFISLSDVGKDYLEYEKKRKPIWYQDLDSDEKRRECKAGILLALNQGDMEKSILDSLITEIGIGTSIINDIKDVKISLQDGKYSLETPISFDLYQDVPVTVRNSKIFIKFLSVIEHGEIIQKIPVIEKGKKPSIAQKPMPVIYRRKKITPRKLTTRDQLSRMYNPPTLSIEEQLQRTELIKERDSVHQETVKKMYDKYEKISGIEITDGRYDLLVKKNKIKVLHEIKTITAQNESGQVRNALGQLYYYQYFELQDCKGFQLVKVVVFNKKPSDASHIDFLHSHSILTLWFEGDTLQGDEQSMKEITKILQS